MAGKEGVRAVDVWCPGGTQFQFAEGDVLLVEAGIILGRSGENQAIAKARDGSRVWHEMLAPGVKQLTRRGAVDATP